jgi:hypothetical protein
MRAALVFCLAIGCSFAAAKEGPYRPPRLADGKPDLQGMWEHQDSTPLARPADCPTLVVSRERAMEIAGHLEADAEDRSTPTEPTEFFKPRAPSPIRGEYRSSIIVDPADGQIPGNERFVEWAKQTRANVTTAVDGPEQRPTSERCLGNPASQAPNLYNPGTNLHQIVQTRDTVVFVAEVMHEARIIRIGGVHRPAAVTSWSGDSIAWWEGDTLVVETKYFTVSDSARMARPILFKVTPQTVVTERITRIADDELNYVFTVADPLYYTRPWTGETHFLRTSDRILEYACHEANYSLTNILQAGRVRDGQAAPKN